MADKKNDLSLKVFCPEDACMAEAEPPLPVADATLAGRN